MGWCAGVLAFVILGALPPSSGCVKPENTSPEDVRVDVVASGLQIPWAIDFAPDGRLFLTERPGRIRVIRDGELQSEPWAQIPVAHEGEGGLLGLALDPNFAENGFVYVYYTYREGTRLWNRVARLTDREGRGEDLVVLLDRIPGSTIHNGGRIRFGPDGKLYITTGDANVPTSAQDLASLAGKILRLNPDGSIPTDNPFPNSPVWSYGHRNPQGLAWHPVTGTLFSTEHGPSGLPPNCCHDEVNVIEPGQNYGWPSVFGIRGDPRFVDPILESGLDTWAPSGAAFYSGDQLPESWRGRFFFAALRGQHLGRVTLRSPDLRSVERFEKLFVGEFGRLRDVVQGPDGFLYVTTSNRDGRGIPRSGDDRLLRIAPVR
ncbi:Aldose sugar dehydrogenase YliI [bacterium HR10]|nr:Aldose sugar dehydrogenase YliI [bacterium HR10]